MSDDLVKRLRATTDGATVNPDGPEAADRIAALEAAVTQCRTLSAMLKPQADRIAELEAALTTARRDAMEEAAKLVETHVYTVSNFEPQFRLTPDRRAKDDMHHTTIAAAIRAALEGGKS